MPVTIHELAEHRLGKTGDLTGGDYHEAGLQILGGCEICGASLAGYNGYPSKSGYWRCADCLGDDGWDEVAQANRDIFDTPLVEEYDWGRD